MSHLFKRVLLTCVLATGVMLLSGCGGSPSGAPDTGTSDAPLPLQTMEATPGLSFDKSLPPAVIGIAASAAADPFVDTLLKTIENDAPDHKVTLDIRRANGLAQSVQVFCSTGADAVVLVTNQKRGWDGVVVTARNTKTPLLVLGQGVRVSEPGALACRIVPDAAAIDAALRERAGQRGILELQTTGLAAPFWRDSLGITVLAKQNAANQLEARRSATALANVFGEQVGLAITYSPEIKAGVAEALAYHDKGAPVPVLDLANAVRPAEGAATALFELVERIRQGKATESEIPLGLVFDAN